MTFIQNYLSSFKGLSKESWMLCLVMFLNRAGAMVLPFLGIYINTSLGYSISDAGIVLSCYGVGSIVGSTFGGWLTDKIGNYYVQVASLFLSVPMYFILPHFKTLLGLSLAMLVLSLISECLRPANSVAISKFAKPENLTRAFSLNRLALNLGFSVGPAIGGFLSAISFDLLFYINGIACFVAGVTFVAFFRKREERNKETITKAEKIKSQSPYKDMPFIYFTIICTLFCVCFFQLLSTLPLYLKDGKGLVESEIGLIMGYSGLLIVLLELPLVKLVEKKMSIASILFYGTIVTAFSFFIYIFNPVLLFLYVAITLMSIGEMLILPFMSTVTAMRSDEINKGAYMGMNGLAPAISLVISPVLGTYIIQSSSYTVLWLGTFILLILTAIGFYHSTIRLIGKRTAS